MARIKIDLPDHFSFSTTIPVRITDLNYGGHVGNDTILSIIHEARVQYLQQWGYGELTLAGVGLIMSDVGIEFKSELFYGQTIRASVTAADLTKLSFDLYYKLEVEKEGKIVLVAAAKTGMICYDYEKKKIAAIPEEVREKLTQ
jgi:acyl-CoA thioester hydrolase